MNENEQLPLEESECSPQTEQAEETLLEGVEDTAENTVEEPSQSLPKKRKLKKGDVIFYVVIAVLFVFILCFRTWWTSHYGAVEVVGNSMQQTLKSGDELYLRFVDDKHKAQRGDIIVVYVGDYEECSSMRDQYVIKRLIAIEGDKVRCTDGQVEICYAGTQSFVPLQEPYAYYGNYASSYDFAEYTVGENEIFFLGDNRSHEGSSVDSRYQEGKSHLTHLYKEKDIYGVVPNWALNIRWLSKLLI